MKKRAIYIFWFMQTVFFNSFFCMETVFGHEGSRIKLFSQKIVSSEKKNNQFFCGKEIMGQEQFGASVLDNREEPKVVMISSLPDATIPKMGLICAKSGVNFYLLDLEKNSWIITWLEKRLHYNAIAFPLFLFFQDNQLLLPLCQGNLNEENLIKIIQKKFKGLKASQNHSTFLETALPISMDLTFAGTFAVRAQ